MRDRRGRADRRPRRDGEGSAHKLLIGTAIAVVVAAIAAILGWSFLAQRSAIQTDPITLCPTTGPTGVTVLLIDATDSVNALQRAAIANRLKKIMDEAKAYERVSVFEIRPGRDLLTPVFEMCRPVAPSEVSELTGNKRRAHERFESKFKPALSTALAVLMEREATDTSPVMAAIQAASVRSFQAGDLKPPSGAEPVRRLIVVSDMLEHSEAGSHYRSSPDFDTYRSTPAFARFTSDLQGVDVFILYLRRDDATAVQGRPHIDFWDRWFSAQGATVQRAVPIEG